jgi:hypothetical protein
VSQSREQQADKEYKLAVLERFDGMAGLRRGLKMVAAEKKEWAGIPMPLTGEHLVIEPTYPKAKELMEFNALPAVTEEDTTKRIRNVFYSGKKGRDVVIWDDTVTGKVDWGAPGRVNHFGLDLKTLGCSEAWGIEQEHNALQLLGTLIKHRPFKQYLLTGMFLETSKRSNITYVFRKLRPTIALSMHGEESRVLAALCQHPIGYYAGSWAGAMCPTDDVIAMLMLMRGDEHMLWKRSNQHPAWRPEAGL